MLTKSREVVDDIGIDVVHGGAGRTLLFLHGVDGVDASSEFLRGLCADHRVIAPWHPGFGHAELPSDVRTVGDLAFHYLQFVRQHEIDDAVMVGTSFGGWLAAEIAIRSTAAFSHLVLIDPLGIKVNGREDRDIADVFAMSQEELTRRAYHDPAKRTRDYSTMSDEELLAIARSREAYTYFGWKPYMHNPSLRRWLRRIDIPTLVLWGASDGIVTPDYGRAFADAIPGARFEIVSEAGHYPHSERPEQVRALIDDFVSRPNIARSAS